MADFLKILLCLSVGAQALRTGEVVNVIRNRFFTCDCRVLLYSLPHAGDSVFSQHVRNQCGWKVAYVNQLREAYPFSIKPLLKHDVAQDYLERLPRWSRVWIVSVVRNPFDRAMADFYHRFGCRYGDDVATAAEDFHEWLASHHFQNNVGKFFTLLSNTTGVEIRPQDFGKEETGLISKDVVRESPKGPLFSKYFKVVVVRMEDMAQWPAILHPYFRKFKVAPNHDFAEGTHDSAVFKNFTSSLQFTRDEVDMILKSEEAQFYSTAELEGMTASLNVIPSNRTFRGAGPSRGKEMVCVGKGSKEK